MEKLASSDLLSLEAYHGRRAQIRSEVMAHKRDRKLAVGPNATLYFEDLMTIRYQVQEMLRVERIFESEAIQEELDAYNPLIPDGSNWKATFMVEFEEVTERREALQRLVDVEHRVWIQVDGFDRIYAIPDEDLGRSTEDKTSAVHFVRFQLSPVMLDAARRAATILRAGIDHPHYQHVVDPIPLDIARSLKRDLL